MSKEKQLETQIERLKAEIERLKAELSRHKGSSCEEASTFEECMTPGYGDFE